MLLVSRRHERSLTIGSEWFMAQNHPTFSLMLPSDPRMLSVARAFLEAACQALRVDRRATHAVVLAGGEAVGNIIRHAHRDKPLAQIQIQLQVTPEEIVPDLEDEGEPFDLAAVPHMAPGELRLGGRGVYMMRTLMDQISCQPRAAQGNWLHMVKRWPAAAIRDCG
jgi:serine/threonine-protein kinase RsbW